ncbi:undecaprenyldiphospho-muramoylpentapeptide beta-N-acetylglucosaminyltransferase [Aurantibacillus circumpalustris]|uniref:undecaprenyldiphospho-muramoylpentapeptide beta-N-acetylglucosaminyltransferase n=1 Tax=Aurantibacillus circumpalustris TaxID=3036359 RepID=UPI00295A5F72|nr:undecaprenyldiphospho-muramoylpentapeptide beta-N-acetylglucosaminyltransferase [Aurantibacillus circumpalustris]
MKKLKVILSGGGTGGHIFPAVSIANELKKLVPDIEILFVGALGKMEMEKVPLAGYQIIGVPIAGLQRKLTLANLKLPFLIIQSLLKTRKIIKEFQPDVVVGTGGYASGPLLRAATSKGIPALLQEQNSYAGITNKLLSKKASKICVAYEGMEKFFPKEKIILTGNPVRQDLKDVRSKREEALSFFKLDPSKKTILVIGGSLGAKTINEALGVGLQKLVENDIQLIWQTGKGYYQTAKDQTKSFSKNNINALDFISRMDLAYAVSDIVISRAGASSVSELCNIGIPCILVPSPNVAEDHQTKNAMALVNKEAAVLVKDAEARQTLIQAAIELITNEQRQVALTNNISKMAFFDSANVIATEVLKLANYTL